MKTNTTKSMMITALCIALGLLLPIVTAQIPSIGNALLPMHIPILICGFAVGWKYGLVSGIITPLLRSALFGMPPMFPTAFAMAFELAAYGCSAGIFYRYWKKFHRVSYRGIILSLIGSMLAGRIVWGIVMMILMGCTGAQFGFTVFLSGALLNAVPGIILQLLLIPVLIYALEKANVIEHA